MKFKGFTPLEKATNKISTKISCKADGSMIPPSAYPIRKKSSLTGFTLIEMMVVVVIIGILAIIAMPTMIKNQEKSRQAEAIEILTRMYQGYKIAIIDGTICLPSDGDFCNGTIFSPEESDHSTVNPYGYSQPSWAILGFTVNPNMVYNTSYFTYQALKASESSFVHTATGHNGSRPPGSNNAIIGLAFRKTSDTRSDYQLFPVDTSKWIYMNLTTGTIGKSSDYQ